MSNKNKILTFLLILLLFLTGFSESTSDISKVDTVQVTESAPYSLSVTITAYSSTPDQTDSSPFITASGERVRDGIMAANFLPFGTKVQVPELFGDKVFVVKDRMHKRKVNFVDVWMPTREDALRFGIHETEIVVVELPEPSTLVLR